MRRFVPTLIALILIVSCCACSEELEEQYIRMYVLCRPSDYVNVRVFPSTDSNGIGMLECGDEVVTDGETKIDKKGRTWVKIFGFESCEAWVCSMYLQDSKITKEKCCGYVVARGKTALRRSPGGKACEMA